MALAGEGDCPGWIAFGGGQDRGNWLTVQNPRRGWHANLKERVLEIVGGGIAGLSLGIGLRKAGVPVVISEAGSYPRHRLCGEFVNGVSKETLTQLGIEDLFADAEVHQEMTWWLHDRQIAQASMLRPVPAMSRWRMDQKMSSRFQEMGGDLRCQQRVSNESVEGRIWTAGRKLDRESQWLGLKAHFFDVETCSGLEMHMGGKGYLGLTPVEDGRVNVCGLFQKQSEASGKGSERLLSYLELCGLPQLAERLRGGSADESSVTGVSGIAFGQQEQEPELMALGDAERMIPPFTGNGMSMAFEAAECALEPLTAYSRDETSWSEARDEVQKRLQARFQRRIALAKGLHGFILKPPAQNVLAGLARPGWLPFSFLTRLLT